MKFRLISILLIVILAFGFFNFQTASAWDVWGAPPSRRFTDVPPGAWFYNAVTWAVSRGVTQGTSETTFSPHNHVTRAEFVTFIHRLEGAPPTWGAQTFSDVANPGSFFFNAVAWAVNNGIVNGWGDGTFRPHNHITREEMAVMLHRYAMFRGDNVEASGSVFNSFVDRGSVSSPFVEAMRWATYFGFIRGYNNRINPREISTRAQALTVLHRAVSGEYSSQAPPRRDPPPPLPDGSHSIRHCPQNGFPSSHRWIGREGWAPDMIVMHTTHGSAQSAINTSFRGPAGGRVSYHFVVAADGTITQIVPIRDSAWGNGTTVGTWQSNDHRRASHSVVRSRYANANHYTVSIGFGDASAAWGGGQITTAQLHAGAWLVSHIRYEIWYHYGITIPINRSTVIGHNEINATGCPGHNFPFNQIISMVRVD